MTVSIAKLKLENVKRVRIVELAPAEVGLTVIGGDNRQGKTSILDAICYALTGGASRRVRHTGRQEPFRLLWRCRGRQNWQTLKSGFASAESAIKWLERKTEWKRPASTS